MLSPAPANLRCRLVHCLLLVLLLLFPRRQLRAATATSLEPSSDKGRQQTRVDGIHVGLAQQQTGQQSHHDGHQGAEQCEVQKRDAIQLEGGSRSGAESKGSLSIVGLLLRTGSLTSWRHLAAAD